MSKKDYEALAKLIAEMADEPCPTCRELKAAMKKLADRWSDILESDNPRFDRAKFLHACGVE